MFFVPKLTFFLIRLFPLIGFQIITELNSLEDLPCLEIDKRYLRRMHNRRFRRNSNKYLGSGPSTQIRVGIVLLSH
jgi:hypothetical protein